MPKADQIPRVPPVAALEVAFPAAALSAVAEKESWRKEVHRPATATHKWWAKRLGTVFRGIIVSGVTPSDGDALARYSEPTDLDGLVVLDPFGGSGTTAVEALKLGARAISLDINPVATLVQRQAVQRWDIAALRQAFSEVEEQCRAEIDRVHRTEDGRTVLYYFWVAVGACGECREDVRLFDSPVFARHAYAKKYPKAQVVCPTCLDVQQSVYNFEQLDCANGHAISPRGVVNASTFTCSHGHVTKVVKGFGDRPPRYEMFAKMVAADSRGRTYETITDWDRDLYAECKTLLADLPRSAVLPEGKLAPGHNTNQATKWNFAEWRDFFNARQLYCLSLLATAVSTVDVGAAEREALCALFSGVLEFNNMFCSFKGEGTGAVRHMFAHHVLKPERTPLEAHPWGTPQSSGSFSTLMKSRLERAHVYKTHPTDLVIGGGDVGRVSDLSRPVETRIAQSYAEFASNPGCRAYVATMNSAATDIADASVDLVITDPPYMDNVHYSELADFFHAWLKPMRPYNEYSGFETTRAAGEVQDVDPARFGDAIGAVWTECVRVLKPHGLVAFTFHQARISGWISLARSLRGAGLRVTAIQPVKGEMTTSIVKSGSKEPSNLDSVVVCRPASSHDLEHRTFEHAQASAQELLSSLVDRGVDVGAGDVRSVVRGTLMAFLAYQSDDLEAMIDRVDAAADEVIHQVLGIGCASNAQSRQGRLFD